jgi:hypothetical protein
MASHVRLFEVNLNNRFEDRNTEFYDLITDEPMSYDAVLSWMVNLDAEFQQHLVAVGKRAYTYATMALMVMHEGWERSERRRSDLCRVSPLMYEWIAERRTANAALR